MSTALGVLSLAAVYALVLGRAGAADLLTALVVAGVVRVAVHPFLRATAGPRIASPPLGRRLLALPWFVLGVAAEIVRGTLAVMAVVLLGKPARPGVVEIPLPPRTPSGVVAGTLALTLSPGSVLVDVDVARGRMRVHVIDAANPDAVRAAAERFYRRYQRPVFP